MSPNSQDWKEEAYKAYVAKWRAHEAEEGERRRRDGKVAIWLERNPNDAETFTKEHQGELHDVVEALRTQGLELKAPFLTVDAADAVGGYTGQLLISLVQAASPFLTAALVAWIKRPGRRVRVEFHPNGKLRTIEAQTDEQVLSIAKTLDHEARARARGTEAK